MITTILAELTIDSVGHEGHGPLVAVLVCGAAHTGRLHNDVIDDAPGHQEVGEQDEGEDGPGRGHRDPGWLLDFQIGNCENIKNGAKNEFHDL